MSALDPSDLAAQLGDGGGSGGPADLTGKG
jgi:hypothetical protein